jgi:hypothetical protein
LESELEVGFAMLTPEKFNNTSVLTFQRVAVWDDVKDATHDVRSVLQDLYKTGESIVELIGGRPGVVYPHVLGKLQR